MAGQLAGQRQLAEQVRARDFRRAFEPWNPLADPEGYVRYANIDPVVQQANAMLATRNYDANLAAIEAAKSMISASLSIIA